MTNTAKMKKTRIIFDLVLFIILILIDQLTKYLAVSNLKNKPAIPIIKGVLELNYLENNGAAFGVLQNQRIFFVLIAVIIMCMIAYIIRVLPLEGKYTLMNILLVIISSGACGNMIDRLFHEYVVDYIYFSLINFPIFNVADIYVTVATFLFVISILFIYKENDFAFLSFKYRKDGK